MKKVLSKIFKFIAILFTCLLVVGCMFIIVSDDKPTFADTGFSSSHSSGGSSFSSSSSHSHSSSGGSSSSEMDPFVALIILVAWIIMVIVATVSNISKRKNRFGNPQELSIKDAAAERFIRQYLPNFNKHEFIINQYNNYCRMQVDWMNFNMEDMKELITNELYTMWSSQLDTLQLKGEQNIMGQFELERAYLTNATMQNGNLTVTTDYIIKTYDYIVNANTKQLVRGNNSQRMRIHYEMKFRLSLNHMGKIDKCPSCGNVITTNTSMICPFCRSQLFVEPKNWVLTEKTCLDQEYTN